MKIIYTLKNNKVIKYIISRYFIYGIQFLNSIVIAISLGPKYIGIWGFLNLIIMYFSQLHFGLPSTLNIIASKEKANEKYVEEVFGNTLKWSIFLALLATIVIVFSKIFNLNFGAKYAFYNYYFPILIIVAINFITPLFSNILRVYGNIKEISFSQSILPFSMLIVSFFFTKENLLWALLWANVFSSITVLIIFIKVTPFKIVFKHNYNLSKLIISKGLILFIYTSSFYFITYSTRSIISNYYSVIEFGYFTFAFTLANIVNMLFSSFSFLIFPKILNRMAILSNLEIIKLMEKMRKVFINSSHLLIHIIILIFPLFLIFFNEYKESLQSFRLIALTLVLYTNSFGWQGLILAKGKEKLIAILSIITLFINILLGYLFAYILNFNFSIVIISTTISYLIYVYLLTHFGRKILGQKTNISSIFNDFFNLKLFLPFILSLVFSIFHISNLYFILPLFLFLIFNINTFKEIKKSINEIIKNSNIVNI